MRRRFTTTIAVSAALALALPAIATPSADSGNTLIQHGYDPETARVLFSILDAEEAEEAGDYECALPADDAEGDKTDGAKTDGDKTDEGVTASDEEIATAVPVSDTTKDADGETADDTDDIDDINDTDESFECELTAVDATGPNGQVNHGQVVSSVVHALKDMGYRGIGCIVRVFARSDYGKGAHQVKPTGDEYDDGKSDDHEDDSNGAIGDISVELTDESSDDGGEGTIELEQSFTECRVKFGDRDDDDRAKDDRKFDRDKDNRKHDRDKHDRDKDDRDNDDRDKDDRTFDRDKDNRKFDRDKDDRDDGGKKSKDKDKDSKERGKSDSGKDSKERGKSDDKGAKHKGKSGNDKSNDDKSDRGHENNGRGKGKGGK